jgi:hypothetical protein
MAKKLRFAALYGCYLLATVGAVLYGLFWLGFESELRGRHQPDSDVLEPPRHVSAETLRRVGSVAAERPSSFVHFERDKAAGVVRACAFGDSYTYGDEVAPGNDYPALLQTLLNERGYDHVEVVNFGNNWHGFHQAFLLWESVGRDFGCDYVLLGPASFQSKRDTEFNHTQLNRPYYLHARYVLDGDDVRLVDVLGDRPSERFEEYFRFLPRWRYLRYDRNPPPLALALIPRGRSLSNPFYYYSGSAEEESYETYRILLRRMAESGAQIVLLHRWPTIVELARELGHENLVAAHGFDQNRFPYRAPRGHNSGWANRLLAAQFLAHLVEDVELEVPVMLTRDAPISEPIVADRTPTPISAFDRVELMLDDAPLGSFVSASRDYFRGGHGGATGLAGSEVISLLAVKDPRVSLVDAGFAPLDFAPAPGAELSLQIGDGSESRVHPIGRFQSLAPGSPVGVANLVGFELAERRELVFHGNREVVLAEPSLRGRPMTLLVDGVPALRGFPAADRVVFYPLRGALLQLAPAASHYREIGALPPDGTLSLAFHDSTEGDLRVPIADWRQLSVPLALASSPLPRRINRDSAMVAEHR